MPSRHIHQCRWYSYRIKIDPQENCLVEPHTCVAVCPSKCIVLEGFTEQQIYARVCPTLVGADGLPPVDIGFCPSGSRWRQAPKSGRRNVLQKTTHLNTKSPTKVGHTLYAQIESLGGWFFSWIAYTAGRWYSPDIIVVVPLCDIYQDECYGNSLEIHRSYITESFFDRYNPVEKHIQVMKNWTIMNVKIRCGPKKQLSPKQVGRRIVHVFVPYLQPLGLARPLVKLMRFVGKKLGLMK